MLNSIKEILFRIFPKKSAGSILLKAASYLLFLIAFSGTTLQLILPNGLNWSLSYDDVSLPVWITITLALFVIFMYLLGICLLYLDWSKDRKERKHKAKGITLLSLPISQPPLLEMQFFQIIESSRTAQITNLIKKEDESESDWLVRSEKSLNEVTNKIVKELESENSDLVLAVGALAHVPHVFGIGFLLGNRRNINYYCWDRERKDKGNKNWLDVRDIMGFRTQFTHKLIPEKLSTDIRTIGMSIEVSMNNDAINFMDKLNLDAVVTINVQDKKIGNLFSYEGQMSLVVGIRNYLNNEIFSEYKSIEELHITVMGQASFIMRLASEFNQNHFPPVIKIHHYQGQEYPWCAVIQPNKPEITYEMNQAT